MQPDLQPLDRCRTNGRRPIRVPLTLAAPFLLLLAVNTWHHLFWGDELHAWGIVLDSANLKELFHNLHYEGHPGLWHLLLWPASAVSASPEGMRLVHFAVGAAIILTVALAAPFSLAEKILLLMNYFLVFEYTVVARNYGIALLLAMFYGIARQSTRDRPLLIGLVLGLLANTNVYAFFLSGFLALEYVWKQLFARGRPGWVGLPRLLPGGLLCAVLTAFAVWTFFPASDISPYSPADGGDPNPAWRLAVAALRALVASFVPVDLSFPDSFAFPGNWFDQGKRILIMAGVLPFVLAALWTVLRNDKPLALALGGTALAVTLFPFLFWPASIRHLGVMFIGFIVALWLVRGHLPARSWPVLGLLTLGAVGGVTAEAGQWMRPFSTNDAVADWIRKNGFAESVIAGVYDFRTDSISVLLNRPYYSLACECEEFFTHFSNRRLGYDVNSMLPERLARLAGRVGPKPFLVLGADRLDGKIRAELEAEGLVLTEVAYFSGAERDKKTAIYRIDRRADARNN